MKTKTKTYIVRYGTGGGVERCRGTRHLADFIHHICTDRGIVAFTVEIAP